MNMKRILPVLILIIAALLIPVIAKANGRYLSDMSATKNEHALLYLNDVTERDTIIKVGGVEYDKGVVTHPGYEGPSELTYNIEGLGYSIFYAVGGKDASAGYQVGGDSGIRGTKVQMQVYVDGVLKADSGELAYPDTYVFIVDIKGAKELKLVTLDGGDTIYCDATAWADARLLNSESDIPQQKTPEPTPEPTPVPTQNPEFKNKTTVYLSDMVIRNFNAYRDTLGLDENIAGEELYINMNYYEKGISFHAVSGAPNAFVEVDIEGLGFKTFNSYIGICYSMSADLTMGTIVCKVYCDDVLKYESEIIKATDENGNWLDPQFIQVDVTDAKVLRLEVTNAGDNIMGDMSCWGGACVSKLTDVNEIYKTPEPTATPAIPDKTASIKPGEGTPKNSDSKDKGSGSYIYIIPIIAVVIAVVVVIVIAFKKGGRRK